MAEDNSWVFDSLVCFLHGPIWNAPLQTFIEEKSLIFDPNEQMDEHNVECRRIHDEYKNLVDYMLGSFMDEMQISPEQFEIACLEGRQNGASNSLSFHQGLFQQIWAANDIRIFNRMMTQRNVELQLQALDLIERQHSLQKSDKDTAKELQAELLEKHVAGDVQFDEDAANNSTEGVIFKSVEEKISEPDKLEVNIPDEEITNQMSDRFKRLNLFFDKKKIDSADIQSRQEYLRTQRDKILEIKKKARSHELSESLKKKTTGRPTSAQAAQKFLEGENEIHAEPPLASLQLRKTLAKRLRNEVVDM